MKQVPVISDWHLTRCRPNAMNEKFRKVDIHLHGMYYQGYTKRPVYKCFKYVQIIL